MRIVVLAGGVGGAKFLLGVRAVAEAATKTAAEAAVPPHQVTAVINTADDVTLHGLRICPDLDSVMYTLGGGVDTERGWGRADETWSVNAELAAYGAEPTWFGLGDRDIATHLVRTQMLDAGYPLSAVVEALCTRWKPRVRILPMSDDRVETHVVVTDGGTEGGAGVAGRRRALHFQEWWVRHRAALPAEEFVPVGAEQATAAPGVLEALATADVVFLAPSNPVVSIGTILAVPGIRQAVAAAPGPVIGVSPIIGGAAVRGMAERCLPAIGVEVSAAGVGAHYGARREGGLLDGWLVDSLDADTVVAGVEVRAVPLRMTSTDATAAMVREALELAADLTAIPAARRAGSAPGSSPREATVGE